MREISFIGDIHGNFNRYYEMLNFCEKSIQIGDYGLGFGCDPIINKKYFNSKHRFIRGNHDNLEVCRTYPNFIQDGTYENTLIGPMMFIGGAWSIDKNFRTPGKDWWFNEEVSMEEIEGLYQSYLDIKPTIMVTHDIPRTITMKVFNLSEEKTFKNKTNMMFDMMFEKHQPKYWFHGHWHISYREQINGCIFVGLGIEELITLKLGD